MHHVGAVPWAEYAPRGAVWSRGLASGCSESQKPYPKGREIDFKRGGGGLTAGPPHIGPHIGHVCDNRDTHTHTQHPGDPNMVSCPVEISTS